MLEYLIYIVHILVILFVLITPFSDSFIDNPNVIVSILSLHISFVICLMIHWYYNSDMCSLTIIEAMIRGVKPDETFIYRFIKPIYKIEQYTLNKLIWIVTMILLCISTYKLISVVKTKNINLLDLLLLRKKPISY